MCGGGKMAESNDTVVLFGRFFQRWMLSQEQHLEELLTMEEQQQQQRNRHSDEVGEKVVTDLVFRVLTHYQLYYEEKSRLIEKNVFVVLSPPWLTPLERTFLWVGGFKPGLAFRIMEEAVGELLSEEQRRRTSQLQEETRAEERALSDEMARGQESVAAPPLMALARLAGSQPDCVISGCGHETLTELLSSSLEAVVRNAELLRTTTGLKLVDILTPLQSVRFFAAVARLHLKIRAWGLGFQRKAQEEEAARRD